MDLNDCFNRCLNVRGSYSPSLFQPQTLYVCIECNNQKKQNNNNNKNGHMMRFTRGTQYILPYFE
jgi:hypothetical protein